MAYLQLLSKVADGKLAPRGGGADGKKGLVLVWSQVFGAQKVFAEAKELPDLIPERGEGFEVDGIQFCRKCNA